MKLGFVLPHMGSPASPDAIIRVATRAEELGYDSLWVTDRLLYPVEPQTPFAGIEGMPWPEVYKTVLNPLQTLTFAAARRKLCIGHGPQQFLSANPDTQSAGIQPPALGACCHHGADGLRCGGRACHGAAGSRRRARRP